MSGWINAQAFLPKMHTKKITESDGTVFEWEESDPVAAIALNNVSGERTIILGRYIKEEEKFFWQDDTIWNAGDPLFWFPLPNTNDVFDPDKGSRVCYYCGGYDYYAKGLCRSCYNRLLRTGTVERRERKKPQNKVGEICETWKKCKSIKETAEIVGCSESYVNAVVTRQGLRERKPQFGPDEWAKRIAYNVFGEEEYLPDDIEDNLLYAIGFLKERQKRFILEYFKDGKTLDKIAKENGITRERARQIVKQGILHLREYKLSKYIIGRSQENVQTISQSKNDRLEKLFLEGLGFSVRAYNCIRRSGIETVSELIEYVDTNDVRKIRNCGAKTAEEIERVVRELTAEEANA